MQTNPQPDAPGGPAAETRSRRLAGYGLLAGGVSCASATTAEGGIVSNTSVVPFGIDGSVPIDLNGDGEIDFEIDHDRETLNDLTLDFLQLDKNDQVGLPLPGTDFPDGGAPGINDDHEYLADGAGGYPIALSEGELIGPGSGLYEFQESDSYLSGGTTIRANRLIDEDAGLLDADAGTPVTAAGGSPGWVGLGGDVGYVGVRIDFDGGSDLQNYGWIGVRITNEADATGEVVGFAYNDVPGEPIAAGQIPEPGGALLAISAAAAFVLGSLRRRVRGARR